MQQHRQVESLAPDSDERARADRDPNPHCDRILAGVESGLCSQLLDAVNYHWFADEFVITVSGHHTKRGWAQRALQRLEEQLIPLGVTLNREKTKIVDTLAGDAFGFLGFDLCRMRNREQTGYFTLMTPKK